LTKTIDTLVEDVYALFGSEKEFHKGLAEEYGRRMSEIVTGRISSKGFEPKLRMSNLGQPCERKLYWDIKEDPDKQEVMPPAALFKFLFGDILEEVLLYLAKEAGHLVQGEQDLCEIDGVRGKRDAVIDGMVVDVKSCSTPAFAKFQYGLTDENDDFGYRTQLQSYLYAAQDDPLVTIKDRAAFWAVDKTLGKMCLDVYKKDGVDYHAVVEDKRTILAGPTPARGFTDTEDGKSGNRKLKTNCSYCHWKKKCWPTLRTFYYGNGPRHLTKVVVRPQAHIREEKG